MSQDTLRVIARLQAKTGKGPELRSVLEGLISPTRNEEGCISYHLLENKDDPTEFTFVEEWRGDSDVDAHFETDHVKNALTRLPDLLAGDLDLRKYRVVGG